MMKLIERIILIALVETTETLAVTTIVMEVTDVFIRLGLDTNILTNTYLSISLEALQKKDLIVKKDTRDIISGILITKKGQEVLKKELQKEQAKLSKLILAMQTVSYPWHESEGAGMEHDTPQGRPRGDGKVINPDWLHLG